MGKPSHPKGTLTDSKILGLWLPCLGHFPLDKTITWNYGLEGKKRPVPSAKCQHMCPGIQNAD